MPAMPWRLARDCPRFSLERLTGQPPRNPHPAQSDGPELGRDRPSAVNLANHGFDLPAEADGAWKAIIGWLTE